jgi:hypothetical protein
MGFEQNKGYTDVFGDINTAPTGAAQWLTAQIGTTGFFINWLQAGQNDFFQMKSQIDHRFSKVTPIADIHLHYTLSSVPAAGNTCILNCAYTWVPIGVTIPLIGAWSTFTHTFNFLGTETALQHNLVTLVSNIAVPANQTYSSLLFFKATRQSNGGGADSYGGNLGLLYLDAHMLADRPGSRDP